MSEDKLPGQTETGDGDEAERFAKDAAEPQPSILVEFGDFLLHNKKWWITPIILVLLLVGLLVILGGTPAAPFIYTIW